jgi:hypothetical protein
MFGKIDRIFQFEPNPEPRPAESGFNFSGFNFAGRRSFRSSQRVANLFARMRKRMAAMPLRRKRSASTLRSNLSRRRDRKLGAKFKIVEPAPFVHGD